MPFKKLFSSSKSAQDGLNQSAREAIVDLLHYCMYADRHIALSEEEFIASTAHTLDWDPDISYEYYEGKSTGAVTRALGDEVEQEAFFKSLKERLPGKKEQLLALKLAEGLATVDGKQAASETVAIVKLRRVFDH